MARKLAEYTVTEAGFGADLGAEKFFNIKCRIGGIKPSAAVLVVTTRAYALHGIENIKKHVENICAFKIPPVISINRFAGDSQADLEKIRKECEAIGVPSMITDFRETGGDGGLELAQEIVNLCGRESDFSFLYDLGTPIKEKVETVAGTIYGAGSVEFTPDAFKDIKQIENLGFGDLPVCIAKTPMSLSDDPKAIGRPKNFSITVTGARVAAGAGFVVIYTGKIMTMPGLPKRPAALDIDIDDSGRITGLF
jgi:formate--tetrahydrofolate ligase